MTPGNYLEKPLQGWYTSINAENIGCHLRGQRPYPTWSSPHQLQLRPVKKPKTDSTAAVTWAYSTSEEPGIWPVSPMGSTVADEFLVHARYDCDDWALGMDKRKKQKEKHEARSCSKGATTQQRRRRQPHGGGGGHHSPLESHLPLPEEYANASNEFLGLESVEEKPHFPRCTPGGVGCVAIG